MRKIVAFCLALAVLLAQALPVRAASVEPAAPSQEEAPQAWQFLAPGIDYQKFSITNNGRPVNVFVSRLDRTEPAATIDSSIAQGRLSGGVETVQNMAGRYDEAINYWNAVWGNRNHVAAAVNGYFFGAPKEPSGVPWSGVIHSGWYAKRFTEPNIATDAGFAWMMDRTTHIGSCVSHTGVDKNAVLFQKQDPLAFYAANINAINIVRNDESVILYTPQYDASTLTEETGNTPKIEILVELTRPSLVISTETAVVGYIRAIAPNQGSTFIPFDHVVLAAWDAVGDTWLEKVGTGDIAVGREVRIRHQITTCPSTPPSQDWTKTYASVGGDYHFLNDSLIRSDFSNSDAAVRNSRTAIAYNERYVFFIVVDAFDPGVSEGLNILNLGLFARDTLGATDAVSLDSGTSSTMVVNGSVVNNTNCNYNRNCGTVAPEPGADPNAQPAPGSAAPTTPLEPDATQASVGTGMMMVFVEPRELSTTFVISQTVTVTTSSALRLGPGTNYASIATLNAGQNGVVLPHLSGMNGVLAKGSYWWKVQINGMSGWVMESALEGGAVPPPELPISMFLPALSRSLTAVNSLPALSAPTATPQAIEPAAEPVATGEAPAPVVETVEAR